MQAIATNAARVQARCRSPLQASPLQDGGCGRTRRMCARSRSAAVRRSRSCHRSASRSQRAGRALWRPLPRPAGHCSRYRPRRVRARESAHELCRAQAAGLERALVALWPDVPTSAAPSATIATCWPTLRRRCTSAAARLRPAGTLAPLELIRESTSYLRHRHPRSVRSLSEVSTHLGEGHTAKQRRPHVRFLP